MKIVVIGGSGTIGSKTMPLLAGLGHEAVAVSSRSGVNSYTGAGLGAALAGAAVVVDLTNPPAFDDATMLDFFQRSGRNLLSAGQAAGVGHHVVLSVVGAADIHDSGYFRAKLAQEQVIATSNVPHTIVRATQFFEFLGGIADAAGPGPTLPIATALAQPIAAADVGRILADVILGPPQAGVVDIAGHEQFALCELVARYLSDIGNPRQVVADPEARYFGARVTDGALVPQGPARLGAISYEAWIATHR